MHQLNVPPWNVMEVRLEEAPREKHQLIIRDIEKCADYLMGNPAFSGDMEFAPVEERKGDGRTRVYNEMWTGKAWQRIQVRFGQRSFVCQVAYSSWTVSD